MHISGYIVVLLFLFFFSFWRIDNSSDYIDLFSFNFQKKPFVRERLELNEKKTTSPVRGEICCIRSPSGSKCLSFYNSVVQRRGNNKRGDNEMSALPPCATFVSKLSDFMFLHHPIKSTFNELFCHSVRSNIHI